jgi:hypothetical protein
LVEAEADRVHHHLQLTLPRIERDEARARIAAKIAARQVCFRRSARSTQVGAPEARRFRHDLELRIASCGFPLMIFD